MENKDFEQETGSKEVFIFLHFIILQHFSMLVHIDYLATIDFNTLSGLFLGEYNVGVMGDRNSKNTNPFNLTSDFATTSHQTITAGRSGLK